MKTWLRVLVLVSAGLGAGLSRADPVDIPCSQCPTFLRPPVPESGFWFNPLQPGSGFSLELQNDTLAGAYFGYTPTGGAVWYIFSGPLVRAGSSENYAWSVDAQAHQFAGGACLGCSYVAPDAGQSIAHLRFEFLQRSLARFRVDEGSWTLIQPYTYGVGANRDFAPEVAFSVPDLAGAWVLVFQDSPAYVEESPRRAYAAFIPSQMPGGDGFIYAGFYELTEPPEPTPIGDLQCISSQDGTPICKYSAYYSYSLIREAPQKEFILPLGNISDSRFKGEAADGETVEGFRIDHD